MFGKLITALVTPFDEQKNLKLSSIRPLIEHLIQTKSTAVVVGGKTGEEMTLSKLEKQILIDKTLECVDDKLELLVNIVSNNTETAIEEIKRLRKVKFTGFVLEYPAYNPPPQKGIYQHFSQIAASTDRPIILDYDCCHIESADIDTIRLLSQVENIVAIKIHQQPGIMKELMHRPQFHVYIGDDGILEGLTDGAYGIISGLSHIYGETLFTLIQLTKKQQMNEAKQLMAYYHDKFEAFRKQSSPIVLKAALTHLGFQVGDVRSPLVGLDTKEISSLYEILGF